MLQTLDSLGRIVHYAGAYAKTETAEMYRRCFELCGFVPDVWVSDCSSASLKLETLDDWLHTAHVLCFQHFRQHLWDSIATFVLSDKTAFWSLAMKILKWRGYASDEDLLVDIRSIQASFANKNARVAQVLEDLVRFRTKLCIFHVSKLFTNMRIASSIAESTHSQIKGGGEFSRVMRACNFYEAMVQILQLMHIYVDDTVRDLRTYAAKGWSYSPYVRAFMDKAWKNMSKCRVCDRPGLDGRWEVFESVPEHKESAKADYVLPAYTQVHCIVCARAVYSREYTHS